MDLFTAILEQFAETRIDRIDAAMAYRVSAHLGWRDAAARWLALADADPIAWMTDHPAAGAFVAQAMFWPRSAISGDV